MSFGHCVRFFFSLSYLPCFSSTNDQSHFDSPQGVSICWISSLSLSLTRACVCQIQNRMRKGSLICFSLLENNSIHTTARYIIHSVCHLHWCHWLECITDYWTKLYVKARASSSCVCVDIYFIIIILIIIRRRVKTLFHFHPSLSLSLFLSVCLSISLVLS